MLSIYKHYGTTKENDDDDDILYTENIWRTRLVYSCVWHQAERRDSPSCLSLWPGKNIKKSSLSSSFFFRVHLPLSSLLPPSSTNCLSWPADLTMSLIRAHSAQKMMYSCDALGTRRLQMPALNATTRVPYIVLNIHGLYYYMTDVFERWPAERRKTDR